MELPSRPQEPEPPFPYDAEDVRFSNRDALIELAGTLTLPRSPGLHPAAVLISGSGPQDRDETLLGHRPFLLLADHLTRQGIAVLRFDDRDYLTARAEIDPERIGLVGHSEGGLIAPMVAARSPDVAFIVLLASPGTLGIEVMQRQTELMMRASDASERTVGVVLDMQSTLHEIVVEESSNGLPHHFHGRAAPRIREVMRTALGSLSEQERMALGVGHTEVAIRETIRRWTSPWLRFLLTYDPLHTLERVAVPLLALNGDKDLQVWHEQNLPPIEAALRRAGNGDVTTRTLPNLNHLFQTAVTGTVDEYGRIEETFAPIALSAISEWILERFGPAEGP